MGRRENPIGQCSRTLYSLAAWLRAGREAAGLTYEQLAEHTEFSADTLARAASGRSVPKNLDVVLAYARACGLSAKEAEKLWRLARRDAAQALGVVKGRRGGVHISVVKDFADLHSAIVELYEGAGSPPLRSLDTRIGGLGRLPRSTAGRVLKGRSTPSRHFVLAFAEAFGVRASDRPEWGKAWDRADRDRRSTRNRLRRQGQTSLLGRLTTHGPVTPRDLQLLMSDLESSARREPGLKLLVHIPDAQDNATRMTRELLVDQAQREGLLACPQCGRPSFGYDDSTGWHATRCTDCSTAPLTSAFPPQPQAALQDTPTLSLRVPPLPRRIPGRAWPRPADPASSAPQTAVDLATITDLTPAPDWRCRTCHGSHEADDGCRPSPDTGDTIPDNRARTAAGPARPAGTADTDTDTARHQPSPRQRALGDFFASSRSPHSDTAPGARSTTTTPTTRIRINIPGTRPVPPVVVRRTTGPGRQPESALSVAPDTADAQGRDPAGAESPQANVAPQPLE
ncbi:helix-turn-helix domain-containing protein [Streptomyces sp. NPDC002513]